MRSLKSNKNIQKKEDESYYVASANKASNNSNITDKNSWLPTCIPVCFGPACLPACSFDVAKQNSDPPPHSQQRYSTGEPGKFQGRDRVGIVEASCGKLACEASIRENSFYRETWSARRGGRYVVERSSDRTPPRHPAAVRHWRISQSSGTGPCGDCRKVLWLPGQRGPFRGKFILSRQLWYKTGGGRCHVAKRSSDPQQRYAMGEPVKVQGWDRVGIVVGYSW